MTASTQLQFPMMLGPLGDRPARLDEVTGYLPTDANQVSFGFVDATGNTVWRNASTSAGPSGEDNIIIFANTVTGNDANPGTAALPVQTFDGIIALLPVGNKKQCHAFVIGPTLLSNPARLDAPFFPPHPTGELAEPFILIGAFNDSGLGERTSTAFSVIAGAGGVLVTDNTIATGLDTFQGYRLRATSGGATGRYAAVATNTAGGAFTILVPTFPGFVAGDRFVIEKPATAIVSPANTLFIQGPEAWGIYGIDTRQADFQYSNGARIAMESCWGGPRFGRGRVTYILGNLRCGFQDMGIGSQVVGFDDGSGGGTNGACTITNNGASLSDECMVVGAFVTIGVGAGWAVQDGASVSLNASWGTPMTFTHNSRLSMAGVVRHRSPGVTLSQASCADFSNVDLTFSTGTGISISGQSYFTGHSVIGSVLTGSAIRVSSGSRGAIDAGSTVTGSVAGVNDLNVGLVGNASQAALTGAANSTLSDFGSAGSTGCSLTRGSS